MYELFNSMIVESEWTFSYDGETESGNLETYSLNCTS